MNGFETALLGTLNEFLLDLKMRVEKLENNAYPVASTPVMCGEPEWMTVGEATQLLRVSRKTIYNNLERYCARKVNGRLYFNRAELKSLMSAGTYTSQRRFEQFEAQKIGKRRIANKL